MQNVVGSKEGKGERGRVPQSEKVMMTRVEVVTSFETERWHPAWTEGEVVDGLGERGELPSREGLEYSWITEGMHGVGNKREERRASLPVPRALRASLLRHLQALRFHSPGGPRLLQVDRCPLPPRDKSLGQMRIRRTLQSRLELPEGYEQ